MTSIEFLKKEGLLKEGNTEFIITFEDGTEVDVCQLLTDFANIRIGENDAQRQANENSD